MLADRLKGIRNGFGKYEKYMAVITGRDSFKVAGDIKITPGAARNGNIVAIGASGFEGAWFLTEPNLADCGVNLVMTDPGGIYYEKYRNNKKRSCRNRR